MFFEHELDVTVAERVLRSKRDEGGPKLSVFHVFTYAAARTLVERPRLNRFTSGGDLYQRKNIEIAFSAKKSMSDDAPVVAVKRRFDGEASFDAHVEQLLGGVREGRSADKNSTDKELDILLKLPGFMLRGFVSLARWLDAHNVLPRALIEGDPLYASLFVANLGSVGLDAAYHHLYEWGNCPIFATLGRVRDLSVDDETRRVCTVRYTFDERIEDGLYCARALERLKEIVETFEG